MESGIIEGVLCTNSYKRGMGMDKSKERIRKLMSADVRMGEAYYLFSRRRGVKENELNVLYALDDGGAHTQQQIVRDWAHAQDPPSTPRSRRWSGKDMRRCSPREGAGTSRSS